MSLFVYIPIDGMQFTCDVPAVYVKHVQPNFLDLIPEDRSPVDL